MALNRHPHPRVHRNTRGIAATQMTEMREIYLRARPKSQVTLKADKSMHVGVFRKHLRYSLTNHVGPRTCQPSFPRASETKFNPCILLHWSALVWFPQG